MFLAEPRMSERTRRIAAAVSVAMALVVLLIATTPMRMNAGEPPELGPPTLVSGSILSSILLSVPAIITAIAAVRGSPLMLVIAGMIAVLQSFVAFSGATLGFLLPGLLLLYLGAREGRVPQRERASLRQRLTGMIVICCLVSAWMVALGMTETVCWMAREGTDGTLVYRRIPETNVIHVGPSEFAGGCDSGVPTVEGLMISGVLLAGAIALTWLAAGRTVARVTGSD
jgi:hypothetical protein